MHKTNFSPANNSGGANILKTDRDIAMTPIPKTPPITRSANCETRNVFSVFCFSEATAQQKYGKKTEHTGLINTPASTAIE